MRALFPSCARRASRAPRVPAWTRTSAPTTRAKRIATATNARGVQPVCKGQVARFRQGWTGLFAHFARVWARVRVGGGGSSEGVAISAAGVAVSNFHCQDPSIAQVQEWPGNPTANSALSAAPQQKKQQRVTHVSTCNRVRMLAFTTQDARQGEEVYTDCSWSARAEEGTTCTPATHA